jgi:hypothetical protein
MDANQPPAPWRDASGRFTLGNRGRPLGSRNRMSKRVARTILRDFETHQDEILTKLRRWFIPQYVQLVSRLLPRQMEVGGHELDALDETEVARLLADVRAALHRIEAGGGSLEDLEAALLGESPANGAVVIGE